MSIVELRNIINAIIEITIMMMTTTTTTIIIIVVVNCTALLLAFAELS